MVKSPLISLLENFWGYLKISLHKVFFLSRKKIKIKIGKSKKQLFHLMSSTLFVLFTIHHVYGVRIRILGQFCRLNSNELYSLGKFPLINLTSSEEWKLQIIMIESRYNTNLPKKMQSLKLSRLLQILSNITVSCWK